jgi:hypothetical protein
VNGDFSNDAAGRHRLLLALIGLGLLTATLGAYWALSADDPQRAHFNTMPSVTLLPAQAKPETYRVTSETGVATSPLTP